MSSSSPVRVRIVHVLLDIQRALRGRRRMVWSKKLTFLTRTWPLSSRSLLNTSGEYAGPRDLDRQRCLSCRCVAGAWDRRSWHIRV